MLIEIDPHSTLPLGEQVAASIRRAVTREQLHAGDTLPPAREVAAALGINLHTVLRGYQILRDQGLVELRRGRAARLTAAAAPHHTRLTDQARTLVRLARADGFTEDDILTAVRGAFTTP